MAKTLIRHGTDINRTDKDGKTALMMSVINGHESLVKLLLENGADLSMTNEVKLVMEYIVHGSKNQIDSNF